MNEMLANQYFIAERFRDACEQYKEVLNVNPTNSQVKKKLILCYIQIGNLSSALKLFMELISTSINTIIENEINIYNQPCKKMIHMLENMPSSIAEEDKMLILGILWMYCDVNISKKYFKKLNYTIPNDQNIITILTILNHSISQFYKET
jgi:tetratricopeptide (TPR) repeat protein